MQSLDCSLTSSLMQHACESAARSLQTVAWECYAARAMQAGINHSACKLCIALTSVRVHCTEHLKVRFAQGSGHGGLTRALCG